MKNKTTSTNAQVSLQIRTDQNTKDLFRTICVAQGRDGDWMIRDMMRVYQSYLDAMKPATWAEVQNG